MPLVKSEFRASFPYGNAHMQTVLPTLFRRIPFIKYQRQRIQTFDGDFIDLDWSLVHPDLNSYSPSAAILCHGLEGSSDRAYMAGMARALNKRGIDAVAYNYRSCSGEVNLQKKFYNAGATDDLQDVIDEVLKKGYKNIYLAGFSLGANLVLKYGGETGNKINRAIKGIAAISAPCDLHSSCIALEQPVNYLYNIRFLKMLLAKVKEKSKLYPELKEINLKSIRSLKDFDDLITAPLNGFQDAEDYWHRASCSNVLPDIQIPTLILNAADDPILGPSCYPSDAAEANDFIFLEIPDSGGHVGFMHRINQPEYWHEQRTVEFLTKL